MDWQGIPSATVRQINSTCIPEMGGDQGINILWVRLIRPEQEEVEIFDGVHQHSFCEVHICLDGDISYSVGEDRVDLCAGRGIAIAPNTEHTYLGNGRFTKCVLAFSAERTGDFYAELLKMGVVRFDYSPAFEAALSGLIEAVEAADCFSASLVAGYATQMVYSVLKSVKFNLPKEDAQTRTDYDPRLVAAIKYIKDNQDKLLSCEDVARECGLSVKQLGRIFKKHTCQSLSEYIKDCKLKACEELLTDSRYTVKEVGYMLGFENEYYFNSFFKRHHGIPPGIYKKQSALPARED